LTPTVVYDACVLHPAPLRDLLVRLGLTGLFRARWTEDILDEMVESVLRRRKDLTSEQLERTRRLMCEAVPDCLVTGYKKLIPALKLPDPDDRHVLAAAIRAGAGIIVTSNLRRFPAADLAPHSITALSPDKFVLRLIDQAVDDVARVIVEQAASLCAPPTSTAKLLESLARMGLAKSVGELRARRPELSIPTRS
jgi:predicted nucleic acid-binding protein